MRCQMHEIASHAMQQHINMAAFFQQKNSLTRDPVSFRLFHTWQNENQLIKTDPWTNCTQIFFLCIICVKSRCRPKVCSKRWGMYTSASLPQSWWVHDRWRQGEKQKVRITMRQKAPRSGPQQAAASGKHIQTLRSAFHRKKKAQGGIQNSQR